MVKCQFATKYWNYESQEEVDYNCPDDEETLASGLCIFHDENYLQDNNNRKEHEQKVRDRIITKVNTSIDQKEALLCIGYYLPDDITIKGDFTEPVYFSEAKLQGIDFSSAKFSRGANFYSAEFSEKASFGSVKFSDVYFSSAKFSGRADFSSAKFSEEANFLAAEFSGRAVFLAAEFSGRADFSKAAFKDNTYFNNVLFEDGKKILFGIEDLSQFSFMNTDITRVRFRGKNLAPLVAQSAQA